MSVEVFTLGGWDIQKDGRSLFTGNRRSHKSLELLKYFMANRGKRLSPDNIVENLWDDADLVDSKNTLRTQIFRLRQILQEEKLLDKNGSGDTPFSLVFDSGFYIFNVGKDCTVDTDAFERNIKEADLKQLDDPNLAIRLYEQAVHLYKGAFLAESPNCEWTFPLHTHYDRLYVQSLLRLFKLLKAQGRHSEIVEYFEQAVCHEPLEESLHLCFLEALLAQNEYSVALSHYNYITERMCRELSVKPSSAMKSIYRRITAGEQNVHRADLSDLSKNFTQCDDPEGALYCDLEYFRIIYNLEERRRIRGGRNAFLGLATISGAGNELFPGRIEAACQGLKQILEDSLRRGDVFTQWNQYQMILLLTDTKQEGLMLIGSRIQKRFDTQVGKGFLTVIMEFKSFSDIPSHYLEQINR
ncbi:BTAD domain-containing putative transcriptional regulator [Caproiciproducens faecalis]|uniref:Winged helix-turn-helix domain-containing protein n=1 Tax=Caproiciproducens faecalis TaxID=2820301 RepID=A0ABS7DLC8_9FIRM|nr:BTAD domain-containing putative transcriptional regulator [Caproiciproducens faecalis]MBW7571640.1 winged helix-turn-helix domain-containing protein [Caproiciproducens faecalis]